jgi:DNA-binding response OmpR family regulator
LRRLSEGGQQRLSWPGYDVSSDHGLTVDQLVTLSPEVLVTEITPSDMSCRTLIPELRARPQTESPRKIVLIVRGGALERARGLDLGADDVVSTRISAPA